MTKQQSSLGATAAHTSPFRIRHLLLVSVVDLLAFDTILMLQFWAGNWASGQTAALSSNIIEYVHVFDCII